jgi:hypothetical protein
VVAVPAVAAAVAPAEITDVVVTTPVVTATAPAVAITGILAATTTGAAAIIAIPVTILPIGLKSSNKLIYVHLLSSLIDYLKTKYLNLWYKNISYIKPPLKYLKLLTTRICHTASKNMKTHFDSHFLVPYCMNIYYHIDFPIDFKNYTI